jgi:hypothetical protein
MRRKVVILRILSILAFALGALFLALIVPFSNMMSRMDNSWFISRFGPEGDKSYKTYEKLYEMSLIVAKSSNKHIYAFYICLGTASLILGIVLGLWVRDIKFNKK